MTGIILTNVTRSRVLATDTRFARTYWQRFVGLMGKKHMEQDECLIINPCSSVHTHWMRFPIDVVYVNKLDVVVGIDHNLKPWRLGRFYKQVQYVIELNAGQAAATNTQVGDVLSASKA